MLRSVFATILVYCLLTPTQGPAQTLGTIPVKDKTAPQDKDKAVPQDAVQPDKGEAQDAFQWQKQVCEVLALVGDDKTPATKRNATYEALMKVKPSPTEDTRLQLAYVLLALNQKKNADALKMTDQIVLEAKNDVPAHTFRARLMLLSFKTTQAIVELETLVEALRTPAPNASPAQLEHSARFLGLAIGYFTGPAHDSIRPTALAELVIAADKLPNELKNAYESSKLAIEEEYRVLTEEGEEALKALREGLEKEAATMREQLEAQRAKVANESEYAKLELQTNFAALNNQWQSAWNAGQTLSQQGNDLMRQQARVQASMAFIRPPLRDSEGRVDAIDSQRYNAEMNSLQAAVNNLGYQIAGIANQFDRVRAQGMLTERQMSALQARAQQLGMTLAMQNESFNRLDNAIRQKELAAGKAEPKKKTKDQLRREKAFATYDDFNIHKEKKLLLDAISAR